MRGYLDRVTTLVKGFLDLVTIDSLYQMVVSCFLLCQGSFQNISINKYKDLLTFLKCVTNKDLQVVMLLLKASRYILDYSAENFKISKYSLKTGFGKGKINSNFCPNFSSNIITDFLIAKNDLNKYYMKIIIVLILSNFNLISKLHGPRRHFLSSPLSMQFSIQQCIIFIVLAAFECIMKLQK